MKLKKLSISLFVSLLVISNFAQNNSDKDQFPIMTFKKSLHDFGTINEGDLVETIYVFTNTGNAALLITKIKASCGCTVPSNWSRAPIMPGETSQFTVKFNSRNKPNKQTKSITITCNTKAGREKVSFKANVIPDPAKAKEREEKMQKRRAEFMQRQNKKRISKKGSNDSKADSKKRISDKQVSKKGYGTSNNSSKKKLSDKQVSEKGFGTNKADSKKQLSDKKITEKGYGTSNTNSKKRISDNKISEKGYGNNTIKSDKEVDKESKQAKRTAKLQAKIAKASKRLKTENVKLEKLKRRFKKKELKGDLSPNDIIKLNKKIEKQTKKAAKRERKLAKLKRKL